MSLTRLRGTVAGKSVDRLLLTANPGYATCKAVSSCCGGTVHPTDANLCEFPADLQQVSDSGLGPIVLTGDPYRPWRWSRRTDGSLDFTLVAQDPGTLVGAGPHCRSQVPRIRMCSEATLPSFWIDSPESVRATTASTSI